MTIIIFSLLWAMVPIQMAAQVNPQKGYIITNEGDTIHGTIDYRSDVRNARECSFAAVGQTQYTTFAFTGTDPDFINGD